MCPSLDEAKAKSEQVIDCTQRHTQASPYREQMPETNAPRPFSLDAIPTAPPRPALRSDPSAASVRTSLVFPVWDPEAPQDCTALFPFMVQLGPYRLRAELRPPRRMLDGRRRTCLNLEANRIELRADLQGWELAGAFLESLLRLSHFSKGCQQGCVEEAYAHSLATGLVEFAQRNPRAWLWFNLLLSQIHSKPEAFDRTARGACRRRPRMPTRVMVRRFRVDMRIISRSDSGHAFGWYDLSSREVQLCEGLGGAHLPIVAVHELTHAIHHVWGLDDHDPHEAFLQAQLRGWLSIIRCNPAAWDWLVWAMTPTRG